MRGTVLYGVRDIRFEDCPDPEIVQPTDAIVRLSATCVCGTDLWPYRGLQRIEGPTQMGHEYCGVVEEVGSAVGYVGVPHGVAIDGADVFFRHVRLHGGPAPVRRYLPDLIHRVLNRTIEAGRVFDLTLPLEQVAEGYRAMDERRAIKTLLRP